MLSASILEHWDRCRRLWAWDEQYQSTRMSPLGMVYRALDTILQARNYTGPHMAHDHVMHLAATRGILTDRDNSYDIAVNYAGLAEVLTRVLRQPTAEPLEMHAGTGDWLPESYLIDGGTRLMRVVLADRWDENRLLAECHSWRTVGDICVTGMPMTMRVLVIGGQVNGKRVGYWTRANIHPYTKEIKFRRKVTKDNLAGKWKRVYREETRVTADKWVERMASDRVLHESAFNVRVRVPDRYQRDRVLEDIKRIRQEMAIVQGKGSAPVFPMTRSACDDRVMGPCRYQGVCYAPMELRPEETGLFTIKETA